MPILLLPAVSQPPAPDVPTTPDLQPPALNTQYPTPNTQYPTPNTQYPTPNTQNPTPITLAAPPTQPFLIRPNAPNVPPEEQNRVILENADLTGGGFNGRPVVLAGNVRIRYNGVRVSSDRATYNRETEVVTFEGRVIVDNSVDNPVRADYVRLETRTNEFLIREGRTVLAPAQIGPDIVQPVFLQGRVLTRKTNILTAYDGVLTTCDFPNPHYKIGFRQADFIPNVRIVVRDATIYRYEKAVARIRYLVIPVRERRRYSFPPNVGRTNEEGYFIKFPIGYVLNDSLPGLLRVDLMERKGIGIGFDQAYKIGAVAAGTFLLYRLNDQNRDVTNTNGRINHQQYIGDVNATISSDFQNNSYQSVSSNSQTGQTTATFARSDSRRTSNLSLSQNTSEFNTTRSVTNTYTLTETEQFGQMGSLTFRFTGSDATSRFQPTTTGIPETVTGRLEQNADVEARLRLGIFDTDLKANRNLQLRQKGQASGSAAFSGTQRLPDVTLTTDSQRMGGFLRGFPARYSMGYGRFLENIADFSGSQTINRQVTTGRFLFEFSPEETDIPLTPGGGLRLLLGGGFRQTLYGNDAAQYVLTGRSTLTQRLGTNSSLNFGYNYLRPYGGTPRDFRLDQTGANNNLNSTLSVQTYRTQVSLITGYDLQEAWGNTVPGLRRTPWQNVAVQIGLFTGPVLQTRFTASYDINTYRLLDLTNRNVIRGRNNFLLDISARYDPRRYRFSQITEVATIPLFSRDVTLSALSGYNGITHRFEYRQFYLTQSFHDYELLFSYVDQPFGFRRERGVNFAIRLKAFPTLRPPTTGQFGTPLDTGLGNVF